MSAGEALRTPQFAALALAHFACCAAHSGPIFHMVTFALGCGISAMAAVSVYSLAGLSGLGGRLLLGVLADRMGAKPVLVGGLMVQALGAGAYLFVNQLGELYALSIVFGIAYGGVMPLYAILARDYFGAHIMGTVFGAISALSPASAWPSVRGPAAGCSTPMRATRGSTSAHSASASPPWRWRSPSNPCRRPRGFEQHLAHHERSEGLMPDASGDAVVRYTVPWKSLLRDCAKDRQLVADRVPQVPDIKVLAVLSSETRGAFVGSTRGESSGMHVANLAISRSPERQHRAIADCCFFSVVWLGHIHSAGTVIAVRKVRQSVSDPRGPDRLLVAERLQNSGIETF